MQYEDMLMTPIWRTKRHEVFRRDNYICTVCGKQHKVFRQETHGQYLNRLYPGSNGTNDVLGLYYLKSEEKEILQVHHKVYRTNVMPILQSNDDLQTVCASCHQKIHDEKLIPVLDHDNSVVDKAVVCSRCNGNGVIERFRSVQNGICFQCNGDRYILPLKYMVWTNEDIKYPGVTRELSVSNQEINQTREELLKLPDPEDFNVFLDKTQALIEKLQLSAFDERFLIMFPPFPYDFSGDFSLKVRIGLTTFLSLPRPENKTGNFYAKLDWEPDDIWERLSEMKEELEKDILDCYISDPSAAYFYSHDFKQQQNFVIYKAAIDRDFRIQFLKQLDEMKNN
ncbi:HNH endonuclease [Marinifilum fragile]|uniref:HNH endonuclease n=1 Tax=Marinifilum fragile TaxID=570161 RepID=UPI002AAB70EA|nr:HNH endonuclease [Marinifilum fragile]